MMLYSNRFTLYDKIINQLHSRKNAIWRKLSPAKISAFLIDKAQTKDTLIANLNAALGNLSSLDMASISDIDRQIVIEFANRSLNHEFDILGSGWVKLDPIDWHSDFKIGKRWSPGKFYKDYVCTSPIGGYDIKTVWDLNRCHHLVWLAEAYMLTNEERYASEIVTEIKNWIKENPFMYSVNWTCSMDVAIRAINWMYAVCLISDYDKVGDDFCRLVSKSLYEHGFFIINNLEKTIPYSGNHYLSDLLGLLYVFSIFPNNKFAKFCFNFAKKEFLREALIEISPDGTNYEHSISYHRLVTELFLSGYALLTRLKTKVPANIRQRLVKAVDYVAAYTKADGSSPLIGDNDNGRVVAFTPRNFRHHAYICSIGSQLFGKDYGHLGDDSLESMMLSADIISIDKQTEYCPSPLVIFPDNKLAIIRNGELKLFVTNSSFSLNRGLSNIPSGTHTHPDALSFDLSFGGEDFIVDPGAYVYTSEPDLRRRMMETKSHNTIVVDGLNQTKLSDTNVFVQLNLAQNHLLEIDDVSGKSFISGAYDFDDGKTKYSHSRSFEVDDNSLRITDNLACEGQHDVLMNFSLSPNIKAAKINGKVVLEGVIGVAEISVEAQGEALDATIEKSYFSPSYGILENTDSLKFHSTMKDKQEIITLISWKKK